MDYLAAMRAFVRSAELGSFSKAAAEARTKVSTVSRYVAALEADLGAALFNRSTRHLHLTEAGHAFHERAARILADVADAREETAALNLRPRGLLRINIPGAFGRRHVVPALGAFLDVYPDIRVDATLTDATVDLIDAGADLAVRIGVLPDSRLIARKLAPHRRLLCASPDYLSRAGPLAAPDDLTRAECLAFALQPGDAWYFRRLRESGETAGGEERVEIPVRGRVRANDSEALLALALDGRGLALLPTWLIDDARRSGRLVAVLPDWEASIATDFDRAIWGVTPPKKVMPPKVRVFLDFLAARIGRTPYWEIKA